MHGCRIFASHNAQSVDQSYPSGDVVVSVRDWAEQLGKRPDAVANALDPLLREQKSNKLR
jgi:DNA-binding transcriptional regulator YhcF (GntR family)